MKEKSKETLRDVFARRKATIAAFAVAIALLCIGICQNQYADVFTKAVRICLECIGIG